MNIDNLPDDCLLYIFNLFNRFETLLNCASVCERWKFLVFERFRNVKYLSDYCISGHFPTSTIFIGDDSRLKQTDILKWLPKLKILAFGCLDLSCFSTLPVKGLLLVWYAVMTNVNLELPLIEMLAADYHNFFVNDIHGPKLKQLFIRRCRLSKFSRCAKHFPNLKRLHIEKFTGRPFKEKFYSGPVFEKLEILEMAFHTRLKPCAYYGFSLADHCQALKSAFHFIQDDKEFFINSGIKNHFLEDLVLQFEARQDWSVLRRILIKYPNLKHLAIVREHDTGISDENIPELLQLLAHITLIDLRNSEKVTEKSTEYIDWFCRHHNRSISFYYQKRTQITKKWPHLSTKRVLLGEGFDFMKHCFLMDYNTLPHLLVPIE
ncbi:uncharacterized protein LOC107372060 [Tetranychus urticae]|uniref:uncharacterized protein LOC107372060 n=1 Tax=Tetranychus urticae TaxID=32264 RepID=UPI000D65C2E1|nr:uncharacterized protein LOC107372060 [Tetranychus urticae]